MSSLDNTYRWDGGFIIESSSCGSVQIDTVRYDNGYSNMGDDRLKNLDHVFENKITKVLLGHINFMLNQLGGKLLKRNLQAFVNYFRKQMTGQLYRRCR